MIEKIKAAGISHRKLSIFLLFIVITLISLFPFFTGDNYILGLNMSHDLPFHLLRIKSLAHSIQAGQFIPTIGSDYLFDRGYGVFFFYPYLFLYPFSILYILTNNMFAVCLVLIITIQLLTLVITYFSARWMALSTKTSLLIAFFYSICNWRTATVFVREDIAEAMAMILIPVIIAALYRLSRHKTSWKIFAVAMTSIVYMHLLSAFIMLVTCTLWAIYNWKLFKDKWLWKEVLLAGIFTIIMSMFVIIPIIEQTSFQSLMYSSHLIGIHYPIESIGDRLSNLLIEMEMPIGINNPIFIGIIPTAGLIAALFNKDIFNKYDVFIFISIVFFLCVAITPINKWLYNTVFGTVQFMWRYENVSVYIGCLLFAICIQRVNYKFSIFVSLALFFILVAMNIQTFNRQTYNYIPANRVFHMSKQDGNYYEGSKEVNGKLTNKNRDINEKIPKGYVPSMINPIGDFSKIRSTEIGIGSEYMPVSAEYVTTKNYTSFSKVYISKFKDNAETAVYKNGDNIKSLKLYNKGWNTLSAKYTLKSGNSGIIYMPKILYKGYSAIGGTVLDKSYHGFVQVRVNKKQGKIRLFYEPTRPYRYSMFVSIFGLIVFLFVIIKEKFNDKTKRL